MNFFWAFLYNIIAIPIAAGVFWPISFVAMPPAVAGFSELLSSVPVVLSSLSLSTLNFKSLYKYHNLEAGLPKEN